MMYRLLCSGLGGAKSAAIVLLSIVSAVQLVPPTEAQTGWKSTGQKCGTRIVVKTHRGTTTAYSIVGQNNATAALVLLPGGGGVLGLDQAGCPQFLKGNSLVRMIRQFRERQLVTALVDAPSDHQEGDGLAGFRISREHAADIGKVIADVRHRTGLPVWLVGTSRGTISAVNAVAGQKASSGADGIVLTSPITSGFEGGIKPWVAQTVFSVPLKNIQIPILVVAHAEDKCIRTPPDLAPDIVARTESNREQTVIVEGGPGWNGPPSTDACIGLAPHGFVRQRGQVAAGIARFVNGEPY